MWKVIKISKLFCKFTTVVLAEVCKHWRQIQGSILVGKSLANTQGKLICCILGNIVKNDAWLFITSNSHHKRKAFLNFLKKTNEILMSMNVYEKFFFHCCLKSLLREWKVNARVEGNICKIHFWNITTHKSIRRENM